MFEKAKTCQSTYPCGHKLAGFVVKKDTISVNN